MEGGESCDAAQRYREQLRQRREREAQNLASLTGWDISEIRRSMNNGNPGAQPPMKWWQRIWRDYSPRS